MCGVGGGATEVDTTMFCSITLHLIMSLQAPFVMSGFYMGTGDPNPEFITASVGPAEPPSQPLYLFNRRYHTPSYFG